MKSRVNITTILAESDYKATEETVELDEEMTKFSSKNEEENELKINQGGAIDESGLLKELESSSKGMVKGSLLLSYFKYANRPFTLIFVFTSFLLAQALASLADVWVSFWYVFFNVFPINIE